MAKSKTYEMLLKIAGKTDSSLKAACSAAETNLNALGSAAQKVGKVAAAVLTGIATTAAVVAGSSMTAYADFEQAMDSSAVTARATEEEYARMEAAARQMGATTTKTATEAAEAMGYMALAGWDVEESIAGLEPMLRLSEATGMDLARASDLATDSMSALGLGVEDMTDYLDLAVQTQRASNTTAEALMEAFIGCGGAAKTAGVDMGDLSTALGVLANNGVKGAEAGTALNSMLSRMTTNSAALSAFGELGVDVFDKETKQFRGLEAVLTDTSAALSGLSDAERLAYMKNIAGTNYFTQMSYLLDAVTESADGTAAAWQGLEADIMDHSGVLLEVAQANTDNLAGATAIFQSAVAEMQLQIGEQLAPYAKEGLEYLANNVLPMVSEKLGEIIPRLIEGTKWALENKEIILGIGGAVLTAVGAFKGLQVASAAVGTVKNLSTIFGAAAKNGGLLSKVLGMGNIKLALIAGIIAAVAAGFVLLWNKSEKFRETVTALWGQVQQLGGSLVDMASAVWSFAAPLLEKLGGALLNGLERAVELLSPAVGNILGIFTGIADFISGVFSGDWDKALQGLQTVFWNALGGMGNLAKAGFTAILEIGTAIWPYIDGAAQEWIAAISSRFPVLGAAMSAVWAAIQKVWSNIQIIFQNALAFINNVFAGNWSGAWQNVVNIFGSIFSTVAVLATMPMNALANGVQAAINAVGAFLQQKMPFLGAIFTGWGQSISAAVENVKLIFSNIISFIENVFAGNWQAAWENITNIFGNVFGMIVNLAKAPINGVISAINFVLSKINSISVTIPEWVPGVGGNTLGFNLPTIPALATGGVVTAPTILEAGEGGEPEAVLPLSKLDAMLSKTASAAQATPEPQKLETAMTVTVLEPKALLSLAKLGTLLEKFTEQPGAPEPQELPFPALAAVLGDRTADIPEPIEPKEPDGEPPPDVSPLAQLARMLEELLKKPKPGPQGGGTGGTGGAGLPVTPDESVPEVPSPQGGADAAGANAESITFAPVFQFYGSVTKEEAAEAGKISFAEFKRLYQQMKAEERRKSLRTSTQ